MATKVIPDNASNDPLNDLEQLRLIVFGAAKQELDAKIEQLNQRLTDEMSKLQTHFSEQFSLVQQNMADNQADLLLKLSQSNEIQESNKQAFLDTTNSLSSQLEMAENAAQDDAQQLHKRLDEEVNQLQGELKDAVERLMAKLDSVTNELTTSKTDRKTLAQLLANVANNLEAGD
ncbi:hypothetical protein [Glaciecola sp. 1036]|uniref:hypothetical protein n=1 Tax=Alteromonadaceae TaxID=72275 RepID=UPI003D085864